MPSAIPASRRPSDTPKKCFSRSNWDAPITSRVSQTITPSFPLDRSSPRNSFGNSGSPIPPAKTAFFRQWRCMKASIPRMFWQCPDVAKNTTVLAGGRARSISPSSSSPAMPHAISAAGARAGTTDIPS